MKKDFYTTFKTSTIDSILMKLNQPGYGSILEWKDPNQEKGAYWTSVPETWAAWSSLTPTNRDKNPGCAFVRNQYVFDSTGERQSIKGRDRSAPKTKTIDQCVFDYMDSTQLNPSITEEINYEKEYIAPSFGISKGDNIGSIECLMIYKWIAGRHLIKFETIEVTDAILKEFGFQHGIKNYFRMFKLLFDSYCVTNRFEDGVWTVKMTKPASNITLNAGPGQIKIDYITPNNQQILQNIIQDHEEYQKIVSRDSETGRQEETTRLQARAQDTGMVF